MRKIEQALINALRNQENLNKGNTSVEHFQDIKTPGFETDVISEVRLHGNLIAEFNRAANAITFYDCGWRSVTTKSRLNALLSEFAPGWSVVQRSSEWLLVKSPARDNHRIQLPFNGCATFRGGNLIRD